MIFPEYELFSIDSSETGFYKRKEKVQLPIKRGSSSDVRPEEVCSAGYWKA
jgi:hypothetical protein